MRRAWRELGRGAALLLLALGCRDKTSAPAYQASGATSAAGAAEPAPAPSSEPMLPTPAASAPAVPSAAVVPSGWPALEPPDIPRDFCTERVHTLDAEACFALPETRTRRLLIYLHGIVPPTKESVQKTNFELVVANASERANVVALIPRGEQGFAPARYPGWWGWPTSKASYTQHGVKFIEKIRDKQRKLEAALQAKFERVYLAGSSSGAYFVVAVALHGGMPEVDGYGVISGGSGYAVEGFDALPKKPVYVGFGKHDSVASGARALSRMLERAGWPVRVGEHAVPHGAREVYLDEAFEFWERH